MPSPHQLLALIFSTIVACSGCQGDSADPGDDTGTNPQAADDQGPSHFSSWAGEEKIATNDLDELFSAAVEHYELSRKAVSPEDKADKMLLAAAYARRMASLDPDFLASQKEFFSSMYYNGACGLSIQGKPKLAMAALDDAIAVGFHDLDLLMLDEDLDNVRQLADFGDRMETWARQATASIRTEVATILSLNEPFLFDFELTSFDGQPLKLSDMAGKVVVVYLWGTWSEASRQSLPTLIGVQQEFGDKVQLVGINFNEPGGAEAVTSFLADAKLDLFSAMGTQQLLEQLPDFEDFPTVVFIDHDGTARLSLTGRHSYKFIQPIVSLLTDEDAK
jgi:thiol-disulfide isomerase/thioredoxin